MRLHDFLDYQAREHPTGDFAVLGEWRLNYHEVLAQVNQVVNAFV